MFFSCPLHWIKPNPKMQANIGNASTCHTEEECIFRVKREVSIKTVLADGGGGRISKNQAIVFFTDICSIEGGMHK
jgi:hypothetical protein